MIATLSALLLAGMATLAPASAQATDALATKPAHEKKVCRVDQATGTIMVHRTCHTQAEWAAIDKANGERMPAGGGSLQGQGNMRQAGGMSGG